MIIHQYATYGVSSNCQQLDFGQYLGFIKTITSYSSLKKTENFSFVTCFLWMAAPVCFSNFFNFSSLKPPFGLMHVTTLNDLHILGYLTALRLKVMNYLSKLKFLKCLRLFSHTKYKQSSWLISLAFYSCFLHLWEPKLIKKSRLQSSRS